MILTTRRKQISIVILSGFLAMVIAGSLLALVRTLEFFPDNGFNSDNFMQYNLANLKVEENPSDDITGLTARLVTFSFTDTAATVDREIASTEGLAVLGDVIEQQIKQQPAIYNIEAKGAELKDTLFSFKSVSPSDYMDDTYRNAYTSFATIANNRTFSKVNVTSDVTGSGERLVSIDATTISSTTSGTMLESQWEALVKDLPITPLTTYKVTLHTEEAGSSVTGTFSSQEEMDVLLNVDVLVWDNLVAYTTKSRNSDSQYNAVRGILYLSPLTNSNQTTIALTVTTGTNKGTYGTVFHDLAVADPDVALPYGITTTLTVDGEEIPFHVEYPSNREW